MEALKFERAIGPYEIEREDRKYTREGKNEYEYTICGDSKRCFYFLKEDTQEERWCKNMYIHIAKRILLETSVDYYQGMFEITSYFVYFYFEESVPGIYREIMGKINNDFSSEGSVLSEDSAVEDDEADGWIDAETYKRCSVAVTNVLCEKYIPLVENNFVMYSNYNRVFVKLMSARKVALDPEIATSYMNTTLTWFSRSVDSLEDTYRIFAIIISCPTNMPFVMLAYYYGVVSTGSKISRVDEKTYADLIQLEHVFLRTESRMNEVWCMPSKRTLAFGAATLGTVLAILIYQLSKKEK